MSIYSPVITCCEEHAAEGGQHTGTYRTDGVDWAVTLRVPWENRFLLVQDLLGNRRAWPHGTWTDPPRATQATIRPHPDAGITVGQSITYDDALVDVTYTSREGVDVIAESLEPVTEFIKLNFERFRWTSAAGDPLKEDEAPGKIIRTTNLVRTIFNVLPPLPASMLTLPGSVNSAQYTSALLGLTFPAETLLFQPPSPQRTITTTGGRAFNLTMRFAYKPDGWNKFWRTKSGLYERLFSLDTGAVYNNYPLASFAQYLF